jgi:hypothetical protein
VVEVLLPQPFAARANATLRQSNLPLEASVMPHLPSVVAFSSAHRPFSSAHRPFSSAHRPFSSAHRPFSSANWPFRSQTPNFHASFLPLPTATLPSCPNGSRDTRQTGCRLRRMMPKRVERQIDEALLLIATKAGVLYVHRRVRRACRKVAVGATVVTGVGAVAAGLGAVGAVGGAVAWYRHRVQ